MTCYGSTPIANIVERIKKERWQEFRDRHGDWGRDLVLWAGRRYGGLTLGELGVLAGGMDYTAVAMGVRRVVAYSQENRALHSAMQRVVRECAM